MHQRACVALARAHPELHELVTQQCAVVLGMLAQTRFRKLLELPLLLGKVIDTQFAPVFYGVNWITDGIDRSCRFSGRLRRASCFRVGWRRHRSGRTK
jgi:hypothetical protein